MSMTSRKLGIAIIGCGYWGVNYIRVFNELPNARLMAICDARAERLHEVGQRFYGVRLTTDLDEVLAMETVEAIVICTSAVSHYEIGRRCLEAGKHLLIEKPITTTLADAQALIALATAQERLLMVGHTFLYNAGVRKLKQLVDEDGLGIIYYLYARRTNLGPIRQDINAIWDLAPHDISIFNFLMNCKPLWVSAVGTKALQNGHEDVGFITLGYHNQVIGNIHVSWVDPNKVRELVVVSKNRRIVFDDLNSLERVKVFEKGVAPAPATAPTFGEYHFQVRDGDIFSPHVEANEPLKSQCQHFLQCIGDQKVPLTDGEAGLAVVEVLTAIDRSLAQNGAPVYLQQSELRAFRDGQQALL